MCGSMDRSDRAPRPIIFVCSTVGVAESAFGFSTVPTSLYLRYTGDPHLPNPFDLCNESATRDLPTFASAIRNSHWGVFIRRIEWIPQKMNIRRLKCSERLSLLDQRPSSSFAESTLRCSTVESKVAYWLQFPIPQSHHWPLGDTFLSEHIYHDTKSNTCSRLPTPATQSFIHRLQEPQILIKGSVALLACS